MEWRYVRVSIGVKVVLYVMAAKCELTNRRVGSINRCLKFKDYNGGNARISCQQMEY